MDPGFAWVAFAVAGLAIAVAGTVLCREADAIAAATGLSRSWIGLTLLAAITSLPELAVGVSSVTLASLPEIAVGDVLGSCVFNLGLLGAALLFADGERAGAAHRESHAYSAASGIVLFCIVGLGLAAHASGIATSWRHVGYYAPAILVGYGIAMGLAPRRAQEPGPSSPGMLRRALLRSAAAAAVVTAAGISLPPLAATIAQSMGWAQSAFGALFVAGATSLPELAVTVSAVRMGALDLAIGNLLGSNLFDIVVLAIDDLLFMEGPILGHVSPLHALTVFAAIAMSAVPLFALNRRAGAVLCGSYLLTVYLLQRALG
jgi:cation:H+ antiporter